MSFSLDKKLVFIDKVLFSSFSLDSWVKKLDENRFKHLRQELDSEKFHLAKQKGFYPYGYMSSFKKFKEKLPAWQKQVYSSLAGKEIGKKKF